MAAYIYNITPFDATNSYDVTFSYSGGAQAYYNQLVITEDETGLNVLNEVTQTLQLKHTIPADLLSNGTKYIAQILVYDVDNNLCASTPIVHFMCLKTPSFSFTNVVQNQIMKSPSYTARLSYSQENNEKLQEYNVTLYSISKVALMSSGINYNTDEILYTIMDLDDDTQYYIRATGTTVNGMNVDTGYILFSVDYILPDDWCFVDLQNRPDIGAIQIRSNIVTLEGRCTVDPVPFVDGEYVDLTGDAQVIFDDNFNMSGNWTIIGSVYGCIDRAYILIASDGKNDIRVQYRVDEFDGQGLVAYMQLTNTNKIGEYIIYSNYIPLPNDDDILVFCVLRQGNLFDIKLVNKGR